MKKEDKPLVGNYSDVIAFINYNSRTGCYAVHLEEFGHPHIQLGETSYPMTLEAAKRIAKERGAKRIIV